MITGAFHDDLPMIPVTLSWSSGSQTEFAVLDTGFTGDIQISPQLATELELRSEGYMLITVAGGSRTAVPVATAIAAMESSGRKVDVLIGEGVSLVGIRFLSKFGYKAIVDCRYKKVALQKA